MLNHFFNGDKKEVDDVSIFCDESAIDVLKELGQISKEDYDYYEKL